MKKILLNNTLTTLILPKKTDLITISFSVNVGSNNEDEKVNGISHFVEHLIFEGTKKYKNSLELNQVIDNFGGELNAMTSKNRTTVYLKVPKEFFEKAVDVVSNMVLHPTFKKEIFEKEKQVVLHEIQQTTDEPRHLQWIEFEKALFRSHPSKRPIAGTLKSVKSITIADVEKHHKTYFTAQNSLLVLHGNITEKELTLCEKAFKPIPVGQPMIKDTTVEENTFTETKIKKDIQLTHYIRGYKVAKSGSKESYVLDVIEGILSKGQTGWLFDEFRNKRGLAYDARAHHDAESSGAFFAINIITEKKNITLTKKLIDEICERLQKVTEKEVVNAKNNIYGKYLLICDESVHYAHMISENYFDGISNYNKHIQAVTKKDVISVAKKIFTKDYTEFILGK